MALRSTGWTVRPSFVPHGPTEGVTLLADETALTQLAGVPDVAWQTPWEELSGLQLARLGRTMVLFATAGGVRYAWRKGDLSDFEAWREVVEAHGGEVLRRPRRAGVVAVVAVVLLASFAGGIAALFTRSSASATEQAAARAANLTRADLPSWFTTTSTSLLRELVGTPGQVVPSTTSTTMPPSSSPWGQIGRRFASCLGLAYTRDRVFGPAGQQPDYQVSSPIFTTTREGGLELVTTAQYYRSTTMVAKDRAEMSRAGFPTCFAAANSDLLRTALTSAVPSTPATGVAWRPVTYLGGWVRAGYVSISTGLSQPLDLVVAVVARGHYEVTLTALAGDFAQSRSQIESAINVVEARVGSTGSTAA